MTAALTRRAAVAWVAVLTVVFLLLAAAVDRGSLHFSDHFLLLVAQAPAGGLADFAMTLVSATASLEVTTVVILVLVLSTRPRPGLGFERWVPLAIFAAANLVELGVKSVVAQPAPPAEFLRGPHLPGLAVVTAGAFPSGHMTRITMVLGLVALRLVARTHRGAWLWLCVAAVWTVGYSRVYLGQHWPADVAGGILLGGIGLAVSLALTPRASVGAIDGAAVRGG